MPAALLEAAGRNLVAMTFHQVRTTWRWGGTTKVPDAARQKRTEMRPRAGTTRPIWGWVA